MDIIKSIKEIFNKGERLAHTTHQITTSVIAGEVQELKELQITVEDEEQANNIANMLCAALANMGIPFAIALQPVAKRIIAYGIRDIKDGVEHPQRLIISRVIEEYEKSKQGLLD